jgi:predicted nucleic acid-binding protein
VILVDLNVILDVLFRREPHFAASQGIINRIVRGRLSVAISAHNVTTLYSLVRKKSGPQTAVQAVDWVLRYFSVASVGAQEVERARSLDWPDFEDAVVAAAAESAGCRAIVTRNASDFRGSPVPAMHPEELVIDEIHEELTGGYTAKESRSSA